MKSQSGTLVARDQARAADEQADGAILTDQANLDTAQINLGYTKITSPITGKIGRTNITRGNVVGPDSGPLTLIVSQDPMYVTFPVSQRELLEARKTGNFSDIKEIKVKIRFSDGSLYDQVGTINFIDVTVDRTTDTVIARATMPNPKGMLIDGQLVRVGIESGAREEKVVIPQAALIADQEGLYVFVVQDGKAAVRRVKPRRRERNRHRHRERFVRRRAGDRRRTAKHSSGLAGPGATDAGNDPRLERCSPLSSSTGRALRSSSPS